MRVGVQGLAFAVAAGAVALAPAACAQAATKVGYTAQEFSASAPESLGGAVTGQKPESKLWYQDRRWWATMISARANGGHTIHRLKGKTWADTGVLTDDRATIKEDVLLVGSTLYVSARADVLAGSNKLRRYTYSAGSYTLDPGFPVDLPGAGAETLTIARDSLGKLWVAYVLSSTVYVARSQAQDNVWGTPFPLPGATGLHEDDIASIVSFTDSIGSAVGVMWSNQNDDQQRFAVHRDGAGDNAWTTETALSGAGEVDDHINLKTYETRVFAAVKTSLDDGGGTSSSDQIKLLVRSGAGTWSSSSVATVAEDHTRPITLLDSASRQVYVFMTMGVGDTASGIAYKKTSVDAIAFPTQTTTFIQGANGDPINDPTSTKQNVSDQTGVVVLASDGSRYWWNRIDPAGYPPPNAPPTASAGSASTPRDTSTTLTLRGGDAELCELTFSIATQPTHGTLGPLAGTTCTPGSPNADSASLLYTPAAGYVGPDSFSFRVSDGVATASATVSLSVTGSGAAGIRLRGSSSTWNATATATTLVLDRPAGTVPGDLLLAAISVRGSPAITAPPGWTLVRSDVSGFTIKQALYSKVAHAADPPSSSWSFDSARSAAGGILAYAGVDPADPIDAHGGVAHPASTLFATPSITTASATTLLVGVLGASAGATGTRSASFALTALGIVQLVALRVAA